MVTTAHGKSIPAIAFDFAKKSPKRVLAIAAGTVVGVVFLANILTPANNSTYQPSTIDIDEVVENDPPDEDYQKFVQHQERVLALQGATTMECRQAQEVIRSTLVAVGAMRGSSWFIHTRQQELKGDQPNQVMALSVVIDNRTANLQEVITSYSGILPADPLAVQQFQKAIAEWSEVAAAVDLVNTPNVSAHRTVDVSHIMPAVERCAASLRQQIAVEGSRP
ncbi:hypothetical protein V6O07_21505 [Arthrospira platensis SPKY2]